MLPILPIQRVQTCLLCFQKTILYESYTRMYVHARTVYPFDTQYSCEA